MFSDSAKGHIPKGVWATERLLAGAGFCDCAFTILVMTQHTLKISYFEADQLLAGAYVNKLEDESVRVSYSSTLPQDVVQNVIQTSPDLVLMGAFLPGLEGFAAAEVLKHDKRTKFIPLVFLTNLSLQADRERGMALGAADYLIAVQWLPTKLVSRLRELIDASRRKNQQHVHA